MLVDDDMRERVGDRPHLLSTAGWLEDTASADPAPAKELDDDAVAAVLFTSGTTSEPKGVVLRHGNLTAYVAADRRAAGRRRGRRCAGRRAALPHRGRCDRADQHLRRPPDGPPAGLRPPRMAGDRRGRGHHPRDGRADHAGPDRRAARETGGGSLLPTLRTIAYGGARIAPTVLERALAALPETGFVNAYGLTETSSTIAVLGPDDHRAALDVRRPGRGRPGSRAPAAPYPASSSRSATPRASRCPPARPASSGCAARRWPVNTSGLGTGLDADGWFSTRDRAHIDADGYLFVEGRDDDTIIRGGENIAPAEVEDVLLHPSRGTRCGGHRPARTRSGASRSARSSCLPPTTGRRCSPKRCARSRPAAAFEPCTQLGADLAGASVHADGQTVASQHRRQPDADRSSLAYPRAAPPQAAPPQHWRCPMSPAALRTGARLRSQVDATEIIVVRAPARPVSLTCGGHPMIDVKGEPDAGLTLDPAQVRGSPVGKRFTLEEDPTLEVLVTKAGDGSLADGGVSARAEGSQAATFQRLAPTHSGVHADRHEPSGKLRRRSAPMLPSLEAEGYDGVWVGRDPARARSCSACRRPGHRTHHGRHLHRHRVCPHADDARERRLRPRRATARAASCSVSGSQIKPHIERRFSMPWSHPAPRMRELILAHARHLGALAGRHQARLPRRLLHAHADDPVLLAARARVRRRRRSSWPGSAS